MRPDQNHRLHTRAREMRPGVAALAVGALMVIMLAACDGNAGAGAGDPVGGAPTSSSATVTTSPGDTGSETSTSERSTSSAAATSEPMDTSSWTTYTSSQYGLTVGYPPGWTVEPATRDWSQEADAGDMGTPASEGFSSPEGDVYVTVFAVPFDPDKETIPDVRAWVQNYCEDSMPTCTGIDDRAVELCVEKRDCHPGLLVPFTTNVEAFFTGGHYNGQLVVVSVWRNDSDEIVKERYGSFQRLLEGFLATMDVWPATTTIKSP